MELSCTGLSPAKAAEGRALVTRQTLTGSNIEQIKMTPSWWILMKTLFLDAHDYQDEDQDRNFLQGGSGKPLWPGSQLKEEQSWVEKQSVDLPDQSWLTL